MKPISTMSKPLESVDIKSGRKTVAAVERSDTCAVPAAAVIGEAMVLLEITKVWREKFGGDSMEEIARNVNSYGALLKKRMKSS